MAQFNLSLDKIIHPARDPSKPMPWWDKARLYFHGRLTSIIQQSQIIYHVSMDPYNRTEEMKWVWSQLYFDWTNMLMIFKGFNIFSIIIIIIIIIIINKKISFKKNLIQLL
jgi:hypothetical protein